MHYDSDSPTYEQPMWLIESEMITRTEWQASLEVGLAGGHVCVRFCSKPRTQRAEEIPKAAVPVPRLTWATRPTHGQKQF